MLVDKSIFDIDETANMLGVSVRTIHRYIDKGLLRPAMVKHRYQFTESDIKALRAHGNKEVAQVQAVQAPVYAPVPTSVNLSYPDRGALEYMRETGIALRVRSTPTGDTLFQPALTDESTDSLLIALAILLGLIALFFYSNKDKPEVKEVQEQVSRKIKSIGLEKEELAVSQREAIAALRSHPQEAQELKRILEHEHLLQI